MSLPSGTPIGKYVVLRKIAEGGMAEIYLAASRGPEGFEKEVVIKRIRSFLATDQNFVQMFIAEARLVSRLNHANLVQIFDFDKHEDTYYLAMEYVRGHSLWDLRKRSKELMEPMPPTLVAQVGVEVARGLHYAHRATDKGKPLLLVHRDVTPHNVLLSFEGAVKLTDFGVAKVGTHQTASGILKGKFAYMAPEQARGEPVDPRTDVFALGIVLWEMLTGGRLFDGDSDVAVLRAVQLSAIAPPARLNPEVHPELDRVVMKALERDPALRFQNANELERALAHFVLQNAKSVDDTDVGAYLRKLFVEEASMVLEVRDGTGSGPIEVDLQNDLLTANHRRVREPTAVMQKGQPEAVPVPVSPDEDVNASTHVVERRALHISDDDWTHQRPTLVPPPPDVLVPLIAELQPIVAPAPLEQSEVQFPRATVGMRRGLWAGAGTFVVILGAALGVKLTRHPKVADVVEAPRLVAAEPAAEPIDAGVVIAVKADPPEEKDSATASSASPKATAAVDPTATAEAPEEIPVGPSGSLLVRVTPWGKAWIDGRRKPTEISGRHTFRLSVGKHVVAVEHAKTVKRQNVTVEEGKTATVEFSFPAGR